MLSTTGRMLSRQAWISCSSKRRLYYYYYCTERHKSATKTTRRITDDVFWLKRTTNNNDAGGVWKTNHRSSCSIATFGGTGFPVRNDSVMIHQNHRLLSLLANHHLYHPSSTKPNEEWSNNSTIFYRLKESTDKFLNNGTSPASPTRHQQQQQQRTALALIHDWGQLLGQQNQNNIHHQIKHLLTKKEIAYAAHATTQLTLFLLDQRKKSIQQQTNPTALISPESNRSLTTACNVSLQAWGYLAALENQYNHSFNNHPCFIEIQNILASMEDLHQFSKHIQDIDINAGKYIHTDGTTIFYPDFTTYNAAINAWSKCIPISNNNTIQQQQQPRPTTNNNALQNCIQMFHKMNHLYQSRQNIYAKPNVTTYNIIIDAYSRAGLATNAEEILYLMKQNKGVRPDFFSYNACINAWSRNTKATTSEKGRRAAQLLHSMFDECQLTGNKGIMPNASIFGAVLSIHAMTAIRTVRRASPSSIQGYHDGQHHNAWSDVQNGANNAYQMLQWIVGLYDTTHGQCKPVTKHFAIVMEAFAKCSAVGISGSAQMVERLLDQLLELHVATGDPDMRPNHQCFVICMDAWVKSREPNALESAQKILDRMEDLFVVTGSNPRDNLNNYGYNLIMDSFVRSRQRGCSKKVQAIIDRMHKIAKQTNNNNVLPDKVSYTTLMKSFLYDDPMNASKTNSALLAKMYKLCDDDGYEQVRPDVWTIATVLNSFATVGDTKGVMSTLQNTLHRFQTNNNKDVEPNTTCWNVVMKSFSNSNEDNASKGAEKVLLQMEQMYHDGTITAKPNEISYATCLNALATSNDYDRVERAETLLNQVIKQYESGNVDVKLTTSLFNSFMLVLAKSGNVDRIHRCLDVIQKMKDMGIQPDIVSYNQLINFCSHLDRTENNEDERRIRFQIALNSFRKVNGDDDDDDDDSGRPRPRRRRHHLRPDSWTYKSFLYCCKNLITNMEEREIIVRDIFQRCCNDGSVTTNILAALRKTVTDSTFWNLLGVDDDDVEKRNNGVPLSNLPSSWSRNNMKKIQKHTKTSISW